MAAERLEDELARLAREKNEADKAYNDALTALDQALQPAPEVPPGPAPYDGAKLPELNRGWDILPGGPPRLNRSFKGRLAGFIWRMVGPALDSQRHFNAALVEHLNRNVPAHESSQEALGLALALVGQQAAGLVRVQSHLIQYLQTVTLFVDTKDRAVLGQVQVLNAAVGAMTDDWLKRWESLAAREERFLQRLAGISARTDDVRATATLAQQTALAVKRMMGATTPSSVENTPVPVDDFKYLGFEDAFRGPAETIRQRLAEYVPLFEGTSDVLDLGCGRGEFLQLLREHGISARGVDTNDAMVEHAKAQGLEVVRGDALGYLDRLADSSVGGIFASQVVEHLPPDYLLALLERAAQKVRPGGVIALETINPACWVAFFESYIRDLTHVQPLHPETLQYLLRVSGFHDVTIEFKSPVAERDRLQPVPRPRPDADPMVVDVIDTFNANVGKLNARLFTYMDYAAIGRK